MIPGQGVEPRSPRSERGVLPVRRSRSGSALRPSPSRRRSTQRREPPKTSGTPACTANDVVYATRPLFDPGSTESPSYVEELWSPALLYSEGKSQAKAEAISQPHFPCRSTEEPFSLGRGLIVGQRFFKLSIFLSFDRDLRLETTKATPWVALALELLCR